MPYLLCTVLQSRVYLGMTTLKELILKRPSRQFQYLHVLLDLSSHEKEKVSTSQAPDISSSCWLLQARALISTLQ